jgi:ribosome production factor 1
MISGDKSSSLAHLRPNVTGMIRNKAKREEVWAKIKKSKAEAKRGKREKRAREEDELGAAAPPKQVPKTLDSMRTSEETTVAADDEEVAGDELDDEFSPYFKNERSAKVMITTRPRPSGKLHYFVAELMNMIPNSFYYKRGSFELKKICEYARNKKFTHLVVLSEKSKVCNGMLISHLGGEKGEGPTVHMKITNVKLNEDIPNSGKASTHLPEIILNNFSTRLGHRIGRLLGSMFPHRPNFRGRRVITFHNQRDFIFIRHHRYIFDNGKRCRLQEVGPR